MSFFSLPSNITENDSLSSSLIHVESTVGFAGALFSAVCCFSDEAITINECVRICLVG